MISRHKLTVFSIVFSIILRQEGDRTETSLIVVASGSPALPRPSLDSLPVELADIIISLLPNKDKISLAQSSFRFLQLVASKLYDSPTMQEKEAVAFVTARVSRCFAPHLSRLPSFDLTHFFLFFLPFSSLSHFGSSRSPKFLLPIESVLSPRRQPSTSNELAVRDFSFLSAFLSSDTSSSTAIHPGSWTKILTFPLAASSTFERSISSAKTSRTTSARLFDSGRSSSTSSTLPSSKSASDSITHPQLLLPSPKCPLASSTTSPGIGIGWKKSRRRDRGVSSSFPCGTIGSRLGRC